MNNLRPSIPHDPRVDRSKPPSWLAKLGRSALDGWQFWSVSTGTLIAALASPFTPGQAARREVRRITLSQIFFTGAQGLPYVTAAGLLIGATIMIQTTVAAPGLPGELVGKILLAVVLRELAPLVTAIIVASRSGTAIATELGTMKSGLEIHGLSSLGIDPLRYVVFPRIAGVVVSVLVLAIYFGIVAIFGAMLVSLSVGSPPINALRDGIGSALTLDDLVLYLVKGVGCGLMVGWLCCHYGLQVRSSPTEVPTNSARAVVRSVLGCVIYNFAVTIAYYGWVGPPTR